jgi:hypothetical protein
MDSLIGWLRSTAFPDAAARLEKEFGAEMKRAGQAASDTRLEAARTLRQADIPKDLLEKSGNFTQRSLGWHGRQTQHIRIIATEEHPDSELDAGLLLAERIIESFRSKFVEPWMGLDEKDPVSDGLFQEFFLAPVDEDLGTRFLEEYYGFPLNPPRERSIKIEGHRRRNARGTDYLHFSRYQPSRDLEGTVAHSLGHVLSNMVFNANRLSGQPDWIAEGFAYWVSFEHLSRNTDYCVAFNLPAKSYGRSGPDTKEGLKPSETGLRAAFNELALENGPDLTRLFRILLVEMEAADLAKSWSFLDFLIAAHPDKLGPFLRACCECSDPHGLTDLERLRPAVESLFKTPPGKDAFEILDGEWKKFARTVQKGERRSGR